jgi:tetratricopeptide (TPR) repeat protein
VEKKVYFSEKLSNILFLDIKRERLISLFKVYLDSDVYMPIKSVKIIEKIKDGNQLDEIPVAFFLEGMFYVMGINENFKYNDIYKKFIMSMPNSINFIKGIILNEVKKEVYEDAFIFLKGLIQIESNMDNFDKLLSIAETIRTKDKSFKEEELLIIEKAKIIENYALPYLHEAVIRKEEGDYNSALFNINNYLAKGGSKTPEVSEFTHSLRNIINYEEGKELLYEDADAALKLLIPLLDEYGDDASLFYYIAVGYRILTNHEKAIYYLYEALAIDDALIEVVNELGINYASLEDYKTAILYLRKAFETTKSIEICTNLIMYYLNSGDIEQAKNHLEIAKKLNSEDEIVKELNKILS